MPPRLACPGSPWHQGVQALRVTCPPPTGSPLVEQKGEAFAQPGSGSHPSPGWPCFQHLFLSISFASGINQHHGGCRLMAARTLLWRCSEAGLFPKHHLPLPCCLGTLHPAVPPRSPPPAPVG